MTISHISAVVLAKNCGDTIGNTLESLRDFANVVVYDNGSTDNTIDIAKSFENVDLVCGEFKGFGWSKNRAASYAKNDWVLIIDSDEVIQANLIETLKTKELERGTVYRLNSHAYYKDRWIKYSGWTLTVKRLYNRKETSFDDEDLLHEHVLSKGLKEEVLKGNINHYSYRTISQFIEKTDRYSTIFAQENAGKRRSTPTKAFFNAIYSFVRSYFLKQGFRDGWIGLVVSFSHMATNFYKYIKLYELNKEQKK